MREIKFRFYDKRHLCYSEEPYFRLLLSNNGKVYNSEVDLWYDPNERYYVEQYTGLLDKKGNEVYEGDINQQGLFIKWNQLHNCFGWFNRNGFISEILSNVYDSKGNISNYHIDSEIIGNIHQNPELT